MLYAKVLRSTYSHARIKHIDVSKALELPGVMAILTGADAMDIVRPCYVKLEAGSGVREPLFPLAVTTVNFVGHEIAAVAATDEATAEDALDLIEVEYEPLEAIIDPESALRPDSPLARDDIKGLSSNVSFEYKLEAGDANSAFNNADVIVEEKFETGRQHLAPMEPSAVVASYDLAQDSLSVWPTNQMPFYLRANLAEAFGIPESKVRVIIPDVGGGFGARVCSYSHYFIPGMLSKVTGAPVKLVLDRREDLLATGHRNGCVATFSLALQKDGKMIGLRGKIIWDTGAWHGVSSGSLSKGMLQMAGPYKIENVLLEGYCVYTNKALSDASRGFGQPQTVFIRERLIDMAAKKLGMDPLDLRLRNVIQPDEIPYRSSTGPLYDSPYFSDCLKLAAEAVNLRKIRTEKAPNIGFGIALYQKNNSGYQSHGYGSQNLADFDSIRLQIEPDGSATVFAGATPQGQGHQTFMAQIVADELGIDPNKVTVIHGDTERCPWGMGTFASRTAFITGGALHLACGKIKRRIRSVVASVLKAREEDIVLSNGNWYVKGFPSTSMKLEEIASLVYMRSPKLPPGIEPTLSESATYDPPGKTPFDTHGRSQIASSYDIGAYAVVVRVDPETGEFKVLDQALAYDNGKVINPMIVEGQHHGSLAHGLGMAMFESLEWDPQGQPLNPTFVDFLATTAMDLPWDVKLTRLESHPINQEWGYRGVGESGNIPSPAAIANAISDALHSDVNKIPITPESVYDIIKKRSR